MHTITLPLAAQLGIMLTIRHEGDPERVYAAPIRVRADDMTLAKIELGEVGTFVATEVVMSGALLALRGPRRVVRERLWTARVRAEATER